MMSHRDPAQPAADPDAPDPSHTSSESAIDRAGRTRTVTTCGRSGCRRTPGNGLVFSEIWKFPANNLVVVHGDAATE